MQKREESIYEKNIEKVNFLFAKLLFYNILRVIDNVFMLNFHSGAPYSYNGNIDTFHEWLLFHPKLLEFSEKAMNIIFHALRKGEEVHALDRRLSGEQYSAHLIRTVIALLQKYKTISPRDIIVLILHDALEDHTECWKAIYESF